MPRRLRRRLSDKSRAMFFDAQHLPDPRNEYVAWVDVMGAQASMSRSIRATANFVFKLHIAALEANHSGVTLYPVMDGFYASGIDQTKFLDFLRQVFEKVAFEFISESQQQHRFIIRGGLAFGPVYHGRDVSPQASTVLAQQQDYRRSILLGMPMVQAHLGEREAPPFGIYVHESARTFAPSGVEPLHFTWWRWNTQQNKQTWQDLNQTMASYFGWYKQRALPLAYPVERIEAHSKMYEEYYALAG
jgi:hypothetical protein